MAFIQALGIANRCARAGDHDIPFTKSESLKSFLFNLAVWHGRPINQLRYDVSNAKKLRAYLFLFGASRVTVVNGFAELSHWLSLPPFRYAVRHTGVLVAGKTEADEPLTVNQ